MDDSTHVSVKADGALYASAQYLPGIQSLDEAFLHCEEMLAVRLLEEDKFTAEDLIRREAYTHLIHGPLVFVSCPTFRYPPGVI
jgi:hypothetical protein